MPETAKDGPRVLILTSSTGGGHLRVANTLAKELSQQEPSCQVAIRDGLERTNFGIHTNPAKMFLLLTTKMLSSYNRGYTLTDQSGWVDFYRHIVKAFYGRSMQQLIKSENPDVIVSTHHHLSPSTIGGSVEKRPFMMVVSDLGKPHRIWFDQRLNKIFVPTPDMVDYAKEIANQPEVFCSGFPISIHTNQQEGSRQLTNTLLLMGGGSGTGNIEAQAEELAKFNRRTIVVCGVNERLRERLVKSRHPNLTIRGYVSNIDDLLSNCDIVITKAGPVTIMESILHRKPPIITGWVGRQEQDNVDFVIDQRVGVASSVKDLIGAVHEVYQRYPEFVQAASAFDHNGPGLIAQQILENV